jgi:hypothetical protein
MGVGATTLADADAPLRIRQPEAVRQLCVIADAEASGAHRDASIGDPTRASAAAS